jgi:ABC-type multidrug transport system fused ATPase/permease subunit
MSIPLQRYWNLLVAYLRPQWPSSVSWTATNGLRADLAAHCLRLDLSFHKAPTPGELIERVDGDVNALATFFSQFFIHMIGNLALVVGVLALLFREDWRVGLAMTVFALGALAVLIRIRSFAMTYWTRVRETSAIFFGFLGEQLAGTEDVRSNLTRWLGRASSSSRAARSSAPPPRACSCAMPICWCSTTFRARWTSRRNVLSGSA